MKQYDVIDTITIIPALKPIMTFSSVQKDGEFLYLFSHDRENTEDLINPSEATNLCAFLTEASRKVEAEKPPFREIGLLGKIGRDFGRTFSPYYGYHVRASFMLRNLSGSKVADFCVAHEDGGARLQIIMFYLRTETVLMYDLAKDQIASWCGFVEKPIIL
ncbi:hypothetical protein HNQ97_004683 [Aminobacter ciceronei]|uniref:DUF1795 domain-containing protein n=2 Tax=Aminobacter ciceronei TaxID=150723 RepID=A0ABR6CCB2_9HYPH|nr:hypothetical protein [Aminobacter ciceronei]MBA9022667.1 hypothetical protein [Aminobacter ciceronei]